MTYEVSFTKETVMIGSFVEVSAKIHVETFIFLLHVRCCSSIYLFSGDSTDVSCTFVNHLLTPCSNKHITSGLSVILHVMRWSLGFL